MDYKQRDTERIVSYLKKHPGGVEVDSIIAHSGADKLRVYPALFELEQAGKIKVLEQEELGAPAKVVWIERFP